MKKYLLIAIGAVFVLSACASMLASKTQQHLWALDNGNGFGITQTRCNVDIAVFVNKSNQATSGQTFRFIATNSAGVTRGEWSASCQPTVANGSSSCDVRYLGGKARTHIAEPDGGCAEFAKFTLIK